MPDSVDEAAAIVEAWNERCVRATRPTLPGTLLCEDCETPIPERRRKALPHARRCIECQTKMERLNAR